MRSLIFIFTVFYLFSCTNDDNVLDGTGFDQWTNFTSDNGLLSNNIEVVFEDSQSQIWIGTSEGIMVYSEGEFATFQQFNNQIGAITAITETDDQRIVAGSDSGFGTFVGGNWIFENELGGFPIGVRSLFTASDGDIWMGTTQDEILIFDDDSFSLFTVTGCPNCSRTFTFFEDSDGIMWLGTFGGLVRYDLNNFIVFNSANGALFDDVVLSIEQDAFGKIWAGSERGNLVACVDIDGTSATVTVADLLNGQISSEINTIQALPNGDVWFGANTGGIVEYDGVTMRTNLDTNGPGLAVIRGLMRDSDGNIWVATQDQGLWRLLTR